MATPHLLDQRKLDSAFEEQEAPQNTADQGKPRSWAGAAIGVVAVLVATGAGVRLASPPAESPVYRTQPVDRGPVRAKFSAKGTVSALAMVRVEARVSGRIETLRKDSSAPVRQGEVLATIEPGALRAAAAQATAHLAVAVAAVQRSEASEFAAEQRFDRVRDRYGDGFLTAAEYEEAEANLRAARAELSVAKANVERARLAREHARQNLQSTTIVSPIDGVVISRNVDVGQTVAAGPEGPALFTLARDLTEIQVDTNVAEADVGKIRPDMPVSFTVDAHPGHTFAGRVREVRDKANRRENLVTYAAVVDAHNRDRLLKPGMSASVTFVHAEASDVLRVPNAALRLEPEAALLAAMTDARVPAPRGDERNLWVLRGGRATPVVVRVGLTDGTSTEVVAGDVHAGDQVIVEASLEAARRARPSDE